MTACSSSCQDRLHTCPATRRPLHPQALPARQQLPWNWQRLLHRLRQAPQGDAGPPPACRPSRPRQQQMPRAMYPLRLLHPGAGGGPLAAPLLPLHPPLLLFLPLRPLLRLPRALQPLSTPGASPAMMQRRGCRQAVAPSQNPPNLQPPLPLFLTTRPPLPLPPALHLSPRPRDGQLTGCCASCGCASPSWRTPPSRATRTRMRCSGCRSGQGLGFRVMRLQVRAGLG